MAMNTGELLKRLGAGESISALCRENGMTRTEFDNWWSEETRRRVPNAEGRLRTGVSAETRIVRKPLGRPPHSGAQR